MKPLRLFLANYSCERTPTPGDADAKPGVGFQICHGSTVGLGEDAESFRLATLATFIASQPPGSGWTRHKVEVIQISAEMIERAAAELMKINP